MDSKPRLAVVTGASSGIGAATARFLSLKGWRLALVARRQERLVELAGELDPLGKSVHIIPADLALEADRQQVFDQVTEWGGAPDVLVNNAGLGWYGFFKDMPWQTAWEILRVNLDAVVHLTRLFLPRMTAQRRGHVINIGSISGSLPSQGVAIYGATKSFLDNFTTALCRELTGSQVYASVARVGPVKTEFCETAARQENGRRLPTESRGVSAETVAGRIYGLIQRPRRVIYIPRSLAIIPWLELFFGGIIDRLGPLLLNH